MPKTGRQQGGTNAAAAENPRPERLVLPGQDVEVTAPGRLTVAGVDVNGWLVHDWDLDGWGPWRRQIFTPDPDQSHTLSVVDGRGRITPTAAPDGDLREIFERYGTGPWWNSEIVSLWWGGSRFAATGTNPAVPQGAHIHRSYITPEGQWRALAVSNNVFLTDVNVFNGNAWNNNPVGLGTNGGSFTATETALRRHVVVRSVLRQGGINVYLANPNHLYGLTTSQEVTVDCDDNTYDVATGTAPLLADPLTGTVWITDAEAGGNESLKVMQGIITPASESARKYWPYWVRSQLIGWKIRVKVWRYMDPEPDWGETGRTATWDFGPGGINVEPGAALPVEPGFCGLAANHLRNGRYFEYGYFAARRLP